MIPLLTVVMTWVFNNAKGSLLITILMHVGFGAIAIIVIAATRGRLSYHDEQRSQDSNPAPLPS